MASRQPVVPVRASMIATLVVAVWIVVGASPTAVAKPPSCAVSNQGNHKDYGSLQAAVTAATAGDTLKVKGTCIGTTLIDRDITLRGVGKATLDGNAQGRVLRIGGGTTTIRDLTITNGKTSSLGGGIYVATAAVLDHVLVTGNEAGATAVRRWNRGRPGFEPHAHPLHRERQQRRQLRWDRHVPGEREPHQVDGGGQPCDPQSLTRCRRVCVRGACSGLRLCRWHLELPGQAGTHRFKRHRKHCRLPRGRHRHLRTALRQRSSEERIDHAERNELDQLEQRR